MNNQGSNGPGPVNGFKAYINTIFLNNAKEDSS